MRVSRLETWFMLGAMCLAGAAVLWQGHAYAADAANSGKATAAEVGNPANDTCLGCHGNQGFAAPGADGQTVATLPDLSDTALYPLHPTGQAPAAPAAGQETGKELLPMKTFLRQQELAHLNRAIRHCDGDKEQAALLLGISIATLYRRLSDEEGGG